ncbi:oleoyl-ACP hydrolase [Actinoplanes sp. SE50]|uniref:thioesterase II family protein n=1 Tax=unclassified Actinoplanes TaxID=2626549 RepID=UPI00023EC179|nr:MULTISPECIES: alpha/beta fold hydrolase [unclassified Actinoplanes]AEV86973.1 thioesterase [Actinoplanes sp. SE50/110]ATO85369.1 oleoyl-ACP hydrolase [Actinoplanes sp. SE50]SLM02781.1 oleoyl-ACP hydrolase [Actinoplanes sp. SE50/110]
MTQQAPDPGLWFRRFHPAPAGDVRLVCFPHAGGSASFYFPVSKALSPRMEVLAVQYPGRQDRRSEAQLTDLHVLADRIAEALAPLTDRRLAFFGHSMGAMLAYEVGLRLEDAGRHDLTHVFASGRRAPSCYRGESVHQRDDEGILAELQRMDGTDPRLLTDPELQRMFLPVIRGDYRAVETYRHRPDAALRSALTVLTGDSDAMTTVAEARDWAAHTTGHFDLRVFPGGHFYLVPQAAAVLDLLSTTLAPLPTY